MKITKFVHSCILVETPDRIAIFDPGSMSEQALDVSKLDHLDDIFITHEHGDHFSLMLVQKLVTKFPEVRITAPKSVVQQLLAVNIAASDQAPQGVIFFDSPHELGEPLFSRPEQLGYHYLDSLTHPGDSHSFHETKAILALPITAPWGTTIKALNLALELKPRYVLPIHDWHWRDEARASTYDKFERLLAEQGITFLKLQTGLPVDIEI